MSAKPDSDTLVVLNTATKGERLLSAVQELFGEKPRKRVEVKQASGEPLFFDGKIVSLQDGIEMPILISERRHLIFHEGCMDWDYRCRDGKYFCKHLLMALFNVPKIDAIKLALERAKYDFTSVWPGEVDEAGEAAREKLAAEKVELPALPKKYIQQEEKEDRWKGKIMAILGTQEIISLIKLAKKMHFKSATATRMAKIMQAERLVKLIRRSVTLA